MATPSKVGLISGAAVRIGEPSINSLDENNKAAKTGANLYDTILESTLTSHHWRFATGKRNLSRLTDVPLNEWQYVYQLPTDPQYLKAIKLYPETDYEIYEDKLYANASTISMDFIYKPDESMFPPWFAEVMEIRLAIAMAMPVTGKKSIKDAMQDELVGVPERGTIGVLAQAKAADAGARPNDVISDSPFIDVR